MAGDVGGVIKANLLASEGFMHVYICLVIVFFLCMFYLFH